MRVTTRRAPAPIPPPTSEEILAAASALSSRDGVQRVRGRQRLVAMGEAAVPVVVAALQKGSRRVRWEAAKTLAQIHSPAAASALVQALDDKDPDVRWLAAEGLVALRRRGLEAVLQGLIDNSGSVWMREGAHHVLRALGERGYGEITAPVVATLEDIAGGSPVIARSREALAALQSRRPAA